MDAERSTTDTGARRPGIGLAARVAAVLLLALAVSIDVLWLVAAGLRQVDGELQQITEQQVPTLLQVEALLREAQRLVAVAPEAVTARDALTYDALRGQVDAIARRADGILATLAAAPALPAADLAALRRRTDALVERLRDLLAVVDRLGALDHRRLVLRERLYLVAERLWRAGAAADGGADAGCLLRWQAALSQLVAALLALGDSQIQAQLDAAAARFGQAAQALALEGACTLARLPAEMPFDAPAMQAEILGLGADGGLFTLERERLRLRDRIDDRLASARFHGEALLGQTERLFAETRARMHAQGRTTRELLRRRLLLLILTPIVLLAVTLGVYWYLSRALLRPIGELREALRVAATGGMPRFPSAGNDEVGAIIDASRETLRALNTRERQLQAAMATAERASRAKSTFLAHMSHELRTPLNAVLGFAELLHGRLPAAGEQREWSASILRGGRHLKRLIDDSLDLAAIEAGRMQIVPADVDLPALLEEIAASLGPPAREKGLGFALLLAEDLPRSLRLDPLRLRQILLNLVGNAIKYTERGAVRLHAETRHDAGGSPRLRLCVEDTGPGIPARAQERLFRPYEQLRPGQPGSGLGLAITRELVTLMGGTIHLASREGRGAAFSVELPAVESRGAAVGPAPAVVVTGYRGPRRRLLVVDDIASNREVIANSLAGLGFQVHQAPEPETAAALAARHLPDLVLMDLAMPDWCGYAGAYAVRVAAGRSDLPVIVVSATPLSDDDARALGFVAALMKPVDTPALVAAIGEVLGLEWARSPPLSSDPSAADAGARGQPDRPAQTPAQPGLAAAARATPTPAEAMLHVPIRIELEAALELAAEERLDDLNDWCDALADGEPELAPFAARVRAYIAAADLPALRQWLSRWL
jgi:signal transduction histidine kinase/DNA-binding NarL/FixJ family response regulator